MAPYPERTPQAKSKSFLPKQRDPVPTATSRTTKHTTANMRKNHPLQITENTLERETPWKQHVEQVDVPFRKAFDPEPQFHLEKDESSSLVLDLADSILKRDSSHHIEEEQVLEEEKTKQATSLVWSDSSVEEEEQVRPLLSSTIQTPSRIHRRLQQSNNDVDDDDDDDYDDYDENRLLCARSPQDARKLLQTAVGALQDARAERESARQWAQSMKDAVTKWVDEQRQLIRCESESSSSSMDVLLQALQQLQNEIQSSHQERQTTEQQFQHLLLDQQEKIQALATQLSHMEQAMSEQGTQQTTPRLSGGRRRRRGSLPKFVDKTPAATTRSSSSQVSTSSSRIRRRTKEGGHVILYGNGVQKEVHQDGTTVIRFANGDVETKFAESRTIAYFHSEDRVMQITTKDGSTLFEYPNRQIERHYIDGSKAILFPDGTKQRIDPNGHTIETVFASY